MAFVPNRYACTDRIRLNSDYLLTVHLFRVPSMPRETYRLVLVVACALIDAEGRVLIAQRPEHKPMARLWEFPGGKIEEGERPEDALIRELKEELAINVQEACLAPLTFASHRYEDFALLMPLYICRRWSGTPVAREHR